MPAPSPIYLDHNATTPMLPDVIEAMRACYAEPYLNPASQHEFGRRARRKLEDARERIGELVGANTAGRDADTILFTSGGTEANNLALRGLLEHGGERAGVVPRPRVHALSRPNWNTPALPRLPTNSPAPASKSTTSPSTKTASSAPPTYPPSSTPKPASSPPSSATTKPASCNPSPKSPRSAHEHNIPVHTDATQVVGKLPVDFRALGVATMTFAAHKFHGPLGIGALVIRHGVKLAPQLFGGFQQAGLRPGTESVALAVGMLTALELWHAEQDAAPRAPHRAPRRLRTHDPTPAGPTRS